MCKKSTRNHPGKHALLAIGAILFALPKIARAEEPAATAATAEV